MLSYQAWVERKCSLAQQLGNGALGGSYAEGAIILCAAISAMSSLLWVPSKGTDRKRFTEIIARFRSSVADPTRVSVPLLAEDFPQISECLGMSEKSLCVTEDIDKAVTDVVKICREANLPDCKTHIRGYSHTNLLYAQVRCGFVHEYQPGENATDHDALRDIRWIESHKISYVNKATLVDGALVSRRLIHFPLEWISRAAKAVARGMDCECARQNTHPSQNLGLPTPHAWWIDGG